MSAIVEFNGRVLEIEAGDSIDFGTSGIIHWFKGKHADSFRMEQHQLIELIIKEVIL
jgi:hypothetical protein